MITWTEISMRLFAAALFGAAVGIERERKQWSSAGMRTHMMVCVGSSLIMIVSSYGFADVLSSGKVVLDPSRVAAQVISGIGFIGAGTIVLLKQTHIRGLTTAAGLWTVAAIGLASGGGMYFASGMATAIALIILWALQPLEKKMIHRFGQKYLRVTTTYNADITEWLESMLGSGQIAGIQSTPSKNNNECSILITLNKVEDRQFAAIISQMQQQTSVKEISWGESNGINEKESGK